MKKKIWIPIVAVVLLAVLFVPIPTGVMKDGGTKTYTALTYKIVKWNRLLGEGNEKYSETKVYFGGDYFKSIDELWDMEWEDAEYSFVATVLEINGDSVLVEPDEGQSEAGSSDKISFSFKDMDIGAKIGDRVKVTYTGVIMYTYPAQINAVKWEFSKDQRNTEYNKEWLDKETAEKYDTKQSTDFVITEIYSDCFFARHVVPMPYTVKINTALSDEWCVGDQVLVTYDEWYTDDEHRMECNFIKIEESDFELEPGKAYKPVIYLYPEKKTNVSVNLDLDGELTCTYPAYKNGWKVTASPDGTLTDADGQAYNYLYWEGDTFANWDMSRGFCVKGKDTVAFLEKSLAKLGLNRKEANEFIVYWLPLMQENEYNIISFQTDVYTDAAKLNIEPNPNTLIRVFMTYKASDKAVNIDAQKLSAPERKGFTVVEWGGTEVK